jgi:hypothetical protein
MDPATTPRTPASTARCNTNRSFRAYRGRVYPPKGLGFEQSPVRGTTPEGFDSERLELDPLGPVLKGQPAQLGQVLGSRDDRQEVIAGELPDLAGETDAAIGEQDLGLADATGVKEELTGCRVARRVLVAEAEVQVAERNPARLAAPPHMDQTLPVRQPRIVR